MPPVVRVLTRILVESAVERSGEIVSQWSPRSALLRTLFPPA